MRRFSVLALAVAFLTIFGLLACGGGKKSTPTATQIVLSPTSFSLLPGQYASMSAQVEDANGNTGSLNQTVTFNVDKPNLVSVANNGLVCAGTWDSTSTPVVCCPGTFNTSVNPPACVRNPQVGTANITATSSTYNVTSSPATASVHQQVDSIVITPASANDFSTPTACQTVGQTITYTAAACAGTGPGTGACPKGQDITTSVGTVTWSAPGAIATADASCSTSTSPSSCVFTAAIPGQGSVTASVAGTVSAAVPFTTCPVQKITLHDANGSTAPVTLTASNTVALTADVVDTKGATLTNTVLQFNNSQPLVAAATPSNNTATITAQVPGLSAIAPSCAPPSCNTGLYPVFGNAFVVNVSGSSASTTVWAASTSGTSLVPIDTSNNTPGTAITLPSNPSSMMLNANGAVLYLGSASSDLMLVNTSAKTVSTVSGVLGKVLAVSPDGGTVVTATATTIYIAYPATPSLNVTQSFANATGAAFSPDYQTSQSGSGNAGAGRIYVVGGDKLVVFSTGKSVKTLTVGTVKDVDFLRQGSFAYTAGGAGNVTVFATCNNANVGTMSTPGVPQIIRALPDATGMIAADSPNLDLIAASTDGAGCPPTVSNTASNLDVGAYTPNQLIVSPVAKKAFISSDKGLIAVTIASGSLSGGTTIPLAGGVLPTTGGMTLDGAFLFIGGGQAVHKIDTAAGTDTAQIALSFNADLVAVQPK